MKQLKQKKEALFVFRVHSVGSGVNVSGHSVGGVGRTDGIIVSPIRDSEKHVASRLPLKACGGKQTNG
jgi:hypothetical protein